MLKFTQQANEDLARILAGLVSFHIGDAIDPALTEEHANLIFDDIADHINSIDSLVFHRTNTFGGLESYGQYVYTYTRNRTNWYAFYDKCEDGFVVNRITNNWNVLLPRL